jgi:hypothetical protein
MVKWMPSLNLASQIGLCTTWKGYQTINHSACRVRFENEIFWDVYNYCGTRSTVMRK